MLSSQTFNYLAKLAHLFDGFFSHWLLISSFDWQIQHSSKDFRKRRGSSQPKGGAPAPSAACENFFDLNCLNFVNQTMNSTANGRRIHRISEQV